MKTYLLFVAFVTHVSAQSAGMIVYSRAPQGAPPWPVQNICTVRVDGTEDRCLTEDGHSHSPTWSPDGKQVLFVHDAALRTPPEYRETDETRSHHPVELSVMDADGRNRRVLRRIEPVIHGAAWSPDGKVIAITAATASEAGEAPRVGLFLMAADGEGAMRLVRRDAWMASWSPDGRALAYTVEQPRGRWRVYTAKADGTGETAIGSAEVDNGSPVWSPNGREIAFYQATDGGRRQQIFVMGADGRNVRQVTSDTAWSCGSASWMPGGDSLVVSCRSAGTFCGMGIYSSGHRMPECERRVFVVPATAGPEGSGRKLFDHDGARAAVVPQ